MGRPSDPADAETIHALGTRKHDLVLELIREQGVEPYPGSVRFAEAVRAQGMRRAVVSSSTNCRDVLTAAGIAELFEAVVDGTLAEREGLAGKPAPDTFLAAARLLGAAPAEAVVDALEDLLERH
jgi:HAD superfamily hydrolase (TIGR01509 family)